MSLPRKTLLSPAPPNTPQQPESTAIVIAKLSQEFKQLGVNSPQKPVALPNELTTSLHNLTLSSQPGKKTAPKRRQRVHIRKPYAGPAIRLFADEIDATKQAKAKPLITQKEELHRQIALVLAEEMPVSSPPALKNSHQ